jgi:hypothetical protein
VSALEDQIGLDPLMPALPALKIHMDVLLAGESQELLDAFLAPDAGLLGTAERCAEEMLRETSLIQT